ncbi:hypothetical protein D6851_15800 [Altericroceibacterium spongiae]|uniref:Uncharacterized protein n=1 Tax=Altericroceibacterium spongiae TaxID=2320269 RepID=A0A420EAM3_9SPHN|nr:hypothetical protein [Altericroceibacterium spongiae]RKF17721.1 hypothetical protein D6851_15800 [Altericroceibacterium spongiae]
MSIATFYDDLKLLAQAVYKYDNTGILPDDIEPVEEACRRVNELSTTESMMWRWWQIMDGSPPDNIIPAYRGVIGGPVYPTCPDGWPEENQQR